MGKRLERLKKQFLERLRKKSDETNKDDLKKNQAEKPENAAEEKAEKTEDTEKNGAKNTADQKQEAKNKEKQEDGKNAEADEKDAGQAEKEADEKKTEKAEKEATEKEADEKEAEEAEKEADEKEAEEAEKEATEKENEEAEKEADEKEAKEAEREAAEKEAEEAEKEADEKTSEKAGKTAGRKSAGKEEKKTDEKTAALEAERELAGDMLKHMLEYEQTNEKPENRVLHELVSSGNTDDLEKILSADDKFRAEHKKTDLSDNGKNSKPVNTEAGETGISQVSQTMADALELARENEKETRLLEEKREKLGYRELLAMEGSVHGSKAAAKRVIRRPVKELKLQTEAAENKPMEPPPMGPKLPSRRKRTDQDDRSGQ